MIITRCLSISGAKRKGKMMLQEVFESFHKVRTFECDSYGHVNNAVYLNYLELARMEVLEKKGLNLEILKEMGFLVVIRQVNIIFRAPAFAGDPLLIGTSLKSYRKTSGTFRQFIHRKTDRKLIAEAEVTWVIVNREGKPVAMPSVILEAFGIARNSSKTSLDKSE